MFIGTLSLGLAYWCTDQNTLQRTFACKTVEDSRTALVVGSIMKFPMTFIWGLFGLCAVVLYPQIVENNPDDAMPKMVSELLPVGTAGAAITALYAAGMSSCDSLLTSTSTVLTRDIYQRFLVKKKLDLHYSLRLIADALAGLDYALSKGVTHRDMKLSNLLISSHGRAKLVDFGLAAISADMSEEAVAAAPNPRSIDYAGLERATGVRKNDRRSDIYFAGCMLYQMLSGRPPLYETRDRLQRLSVNRFREVKPDSVAKGTALP